MTRGVRSDDREIFKLMNSKTLYSQVPSRLRRYAADSFTDKYKRLDWNELSRSITAHIAKDGYWYIHPEEHRTLTVREAARIQTFPDLFRFSGTRSDAFRQIGNAVPPMLGEQAAAAVAPRKDSNHDELTDWLSAREALGKWGRAQRETEFWHMVPGPMMTPPAALAAAALTGRTANLAEVGAAVRHFRGLTYFNTGPIEKALGEISTKSKLALGRLLPLARKRAIWDDPDQVPDRIRLRESERRVYDMLRGDHVLLRSQGVLRVAARVAGSESDTKNRLTDGRMDLARIVGSGDDAATRMAAIRVLASTRCRVERRACGDCPLADWCITRQRETSGSAAVSKIGAL